MKTAPTAPKFTERDATLVNRLNKGLPPRDVLRARMDALRENGWRYKEIAGYYGLPVPTVNEILNGRSK